MARVILSEPAESRQLLRDGFANEGSLHFSAQVPGIEPQIFSACHPEKP